MHLRATGRAAKLQRQFWKLNTTKWSCSSSCVAQLNHPSSRYSSTAAAAPTSDPSSSITIDGKTFAKDDWTNIPSSILASVPRRLHLQPDHPISITRQLIEARFPSPTYEKYNTFSPAVTVAQNFDSLGFPPDHPGRSKTDTFYVNASNVLRTHTSAHEADTFCANRSPGYLISADVYRRDAIDRSHYPIFHQMEGARMWDRTRVPDGDVAAAVLADLGSLPAHDVEVLDPNPTIHPERNPLQAGHHSAAEVEAIAAHLKRTLELVVISLFGRSHPGQTEPLQIRWIEAYFPFTSPSWELEVYWQNEWLELLGCGVTQQPLLINAGVPSQLGWAFGVGLERLAMLLFGIPDIRLFWSMDKRFLSQFSEKEILAPENAGKPIRRFVPFSAYPPCYKDVAFWLPQYSSPSSSSDPSPEPLNLSPAGGLDAAQAQRSAPFTSSPASPPSPTVAVHENDVFALIRNAVGDDVEDVALVDDFVHPRTGRRSLCYRICYRSLERTLTNDEANAMHERVREALKDELGVELR